MIDTKDLAERIISRAEKMQGMNTENITIAEASEYCAITEDLAIATHAFTIRQVVMKSFLAYTMVCALSTIVQFKAFHTDPMVILFTNLAIAAAISAWMTYKLYLCSTTIENVLGSYDKFLARISQKGKEE